MSTCKKCGAEVVWKKKPDGSFMPPQNPDGTRHNCTGDKPAYATPKGDLIIGRLESYTPTSAEFTLKLGARKTYALVGIIAKDFQEKKFLLPPDNHPEIWLEFSRDSNGFIQPGYRVVAKPAWAAELSDPTNGEIKKPNTPAKQDQKPCTSSPAAPPTPPAPSEKDVWLAEKEEFVQLLQSTGRDNIDGLLKYIEEETDFYIAPSSTKYHDARDGGLLHHSLKTYHNLTALVQLYDIEIPADTSLVIIALLHDLCKVNIYKQERKALPRRDDKGNIVLDDFGRKIWDEALVYTIDDQMPLGHGEKSVIMLQRHIRLSDTEIFAIRWHMMAYDDSRNSYAGNLAITNASDKYRIIPLFHMADLAASFLEMKPPVPEEMPDQPGGA